MTTASALAALLVACERQRVEPPPPPSRHEIPEAPPNALGARAASRQEPGSLMLSPERVPKLPDSEDDDDNEPDAGADAGGGTREPEGVSL